MNPCTCFLFSRGTVTSWRGSDARAEVSHYRHLCDSPSAPQPSPRRPARRAFENGDIKGVCFIYESCSSDSFWSEHVLGDVLAILIMYFYKPSTQLLHNTAGSPASRGRGRCHCRDAAARRAVQDRRVPVEVWACHWVCRASACPQQVPREQCHLFPAARWHGGGNQDLGSPAAPSGRGVPEGSQPGAGGQSQADQAVESAAVLVSSVRIISQPSPVQNLKSFVPVRLRYLSISGDVGGEPWAAAGRGRERERERERISTSGADLLQGCNSLCWLSTSTCSSIGFPSVNDGTCQCRSFLWMYSHLKI